MICCQMLPVSLEDMITWQPGTQNDTMKGEVLMAQMKLGFDKTWCKERSIKRWHNQEASGLLTKDKQAWQTWVQRLCWPYLQQSIFGNVPGTKQFKINILEVKKLYTLCLCNSIITCVDVENILRSPGTETFICHHCFLTSELFQWGLPSSSNGIKCQEFTDLAYGSKNKAVDGIGHICSLDTFLELHAQHLGVLPQPPEHTVSFINIMLPDANSVRSCICTENMFRSQHFKIKDIYILAILIELIFIHSFLWQLIILCFDGIFFFYSQT